MKHLFYVLILLCLNSVMGTAQKCPETDIRIENRNDINGYSTRYSQCTEINGSLRISGNDVLHLDFLNNVSIIRGTLEIKDSDIIDLTGLSQIDSIYGDLKIKNLPNIKVLDALSQLTYVGGSIELIYMQGLESFSFPESLTHVANVTFLSCPKLVEIKKFENIGVIGNNLDNGNGKIKIVGCHEISNLSFPLQGSLALVEISFTRIQDLACLSTITTINEINISANPELVDISHLESLSTEQVQEVNISNNIELNSCNNNWICEVFANANITFHNNGLGCMNTYEVLTGCGSLNCQHDIFFSKQEDIDNFNTYFTACNELFGSITIRGNDITNVDSLYRIKYISGDLHISQTPGLVQLAGLRNLDSIGGTLSVYNSSALNSLAGFEKLKTVESIYLNLNQTDLTFPSLTHVASNLIVKYDKDSLVINAPIAEVGNNLDLALGKDLQFIGGLSELERIGGDCTFQGPLDLANLPLMLSLNDIEGTLTIRKNSFINDLHGLDSLHSIYGLTVFDCENLSNIASINRLTTLQGGLSFSKLPSLIHVDWLSGLTSIKGELSFEHNENLNSLAGLSNLESLGGLTLANNPNLKNNSIDFPLIDSLAHSLLIFQQHGLTDVSFLSSLTHIEKDLSILNCDSIVSLDGFENLSTINGKFTLGILPQLTSITTNKPFTFADQLNLSKLDQLQSLQSFENIKIADAIYIDGCRNLMQDVILPNTDSLSSITILQSFRDSSYTMNLPNLRLITEEAEFSPNSNMNVEMPLLTFIGQGLRMSGLGRFNCKSLGKVGTYVDIHQCANTSMDGLAGLKEIGGYFHLTGNQRLQTLDGLDSLVTVNGQIYIDKNDSLHSISGLENLREFGNEDLSRPDIEITDNPLLENCSIYPICERILSQTAYADIQDNGVGCNSIDEIATMCVIEEPCSNDTIFLSSQELIDNFPCEFVSGSIVIDEEASEIIENLSGLQGLKGILGSLIIRNTKQLATLDGLENLLYVDGALSISENMLLNDISALNNLDGSRINQGPNSNDTSLQITNNPQLSLCNIDAFCIHFTQVESVVKIESNATGCNAKDDIMLQCSYRKECPELIFRNQTEINQFPIKYPACETVYTSLTIFEEGNSMGGNYITDLRPLGQIKDIKGALKISYNNQLQSLAGLDSIIHVRDFLRINRNNNLTDIQALNKLNNNSLVEEASPRLIIRNNNLLSICHIDPICYLIAEQYEDLRIEDNADGCSSVNEIEEMCMVSVNNPAPHSSNLRCYPNPSDGTIYVEIIGGGGLPSSVNLYTAQGELLSSMSASTSLDLSVQRKGIYILEFVFLNGRREARRVVIQ